ncbi:MAG: molybdopterin-dependent oxidoreductase [Terriglobales bacterium]
MASIVRRKRIARSSRACCFVLAVLLIAGEAVSKTLQVVNADGHTSTITAAQIAGAPHVTVRVNDHDAAAEFEGVPLSAILSMAGIRLGDTMRGPRMTEVLLVEAADDYKVAFALAEVDPAFATRAIILADKRDGKALDAKQGPYRIVAPGDKRPARWVREVTALRVVRVK